MLNDLQFHMKEKTFQKDFELITTGDTCNEILFVLEGKVEIEIHKDGGDCWELGILRHGDVIGTNSILYQSIYYFNAIAVKDVRVYSLDADFFEDFKHKINFLNDTMENARDDIDESEIFIKDYIIHPNNKKKKMT